MLVIKPGCSSQNANREGPDQTASSEVAWCGSALFVYAFLQQLVYGILVHLPQIRIAIVLLLEENVYHAWIQIGS